MNAKNIFKTLAFAMLMPAILLTSACSNINENEDTNKKGYALPVTVNVTRQSEDPNTKAKYNETTKKLEFSAGDQLFVKQNYGSAVKFAGLLTWQSGGTFTGTIYTENVFSGTADELFTSAGNNVSATLIPCNYTEYNYITFTRPNAYNTIVGYNMGNAYAFSKAEAVEQFSDESASEYNSGFALSPHNAILNFTITGLDPDAEANVRVNNTYGNLIAVDLKSNPSGTLQIAMGLDVSYANNLSNLTLTVNGTAINLGSHELVAGHIYNITRNVALANVTASDLGKVIGADGRIYANASAASAAKTTAVARICYVGNNTGENSPYNHGLALALSDANGGSNCAWTISSGSTVHTYTPSSSSFTSESGLQYNETQNSDTYPAFKYAIANNGTAAPTGCSAWFLASGYQWDQMISAAGGYNDLRDGFIDVGGTNMQGTNYWSSTEGSGYYGWTYYFFSGYGGGKWAQWSKVDGSLVRAVLAF